MRIGIDIDGVLTDIEKFQIEYGSKYFYERNKSIVNYKGYETTEIFGVSETEDDEFWVKYFKEYSINAECRKFANEVIDNLKKDGNEIYIITARGSFLSHSLNVMSAFENQNIVKEWLKKNCIYYDKLIFSKEDKVEICLENQIDVMIEDKPKNIMEISTKIPVICYHANYNEQCLGNNIIRCYSWYDIYQKLNNINK